MGKRKHGGRTCAPAAFAGAVLCGSLLSLASTAIAQTRDAATAEAMFLQARDAMASGNYAEACPKFAESHRLDPAAGTVMNLATCEEKLGKLASAWQHWKEAIDTLAHDDDRIAFARSRVVELEKRLSWLTVTLAPGTDPRASVLRDSIELGRPSLDVPLPVDPGDHTITIVAPGRFAEKMTVSLAEAEQKRIEVREGALSADVPNDGRTSHTRTLGWALVGVGGAGAITAVVTGIWLLDVKRTVDANCPGKTCVNQKGADAVTTGKALVVANTAGYITAAAGLGLGAYFVLSSTGRHSTTGIAPDIGPDRVNVSYVGTF